MRCQRPDAAFAPHAFGLAVALGGQNGLAHACAVHGDAKPHMAGHAHAAQPGAGLRLIDVYDVHAVLDNQMHRLARMAGKLVQMRLCNGHDIHIVDDAAGQLEHLHRQPIVRGETVLHRVAQRYKAGEQPVRRAFGQAALGADGLQGRALGVCAQDFDQCEDACHALHAAVAVFHKSTPFSLLRSTMRNGLPSVL